MYPGAFEELYQWIGPHLRPQRTISTEKKLLATLWYLANTETYRSVADRFGLNKGTLHHVVMGICNTLITMIADSIICDYGQVTLAFPKHDTSSTMTSIKSYKAHPLVKTEMPAEQDHAVRNGEVLPFNPRCTDSCQMTRSSLANSNRSTAEQISDSEETSSETPSRYSSTQVTNLDNDQIEIRSDKENSPVFKTPTDLTSCQRKGRNLMKIFQEPVSLSKTSSLLREVHQLDEEERDLCLQEKLPNDEGSSETNGNAIELAIRNEDEPVTYHVLENSTIVKLEPSAGYVSSSNGAGAGDDEDFDGHTITLVEDEHNAGTFKIAEIGEDNTLRVIDNDRIVVFQDEAAVHAVCREEGRGLSTAAEEESSSACIGQSINALNSENTPSNTMHLYEESDQRRRGRPRAPTSSQAYLNNHGSSERIAAVQTYADTSIMRPLHSDFGSHSSQNNPRSGSSAFPASASSGRGGSQSKTWHSPEERETTSNPRPQYPGEPPYQSMGGSNGMAPTTSHRANYPEYGLSSSSNSTSAHGSYSDVETSYPGYIPQMATWPATGHVASGHLDNLVTYSVPETDQKAGVGYTHAHSNYCPVPASYLGSAGNAYVGYTGHKEGHRPWRAAKSSDVPEHHQDNHDAMLYHQQQQHPHHQQPSHGIIPTAHPSLARPYPTYPTWEDAPPSHISQRHLRYMTTSARGRSSSASRINKTRLNMVAVQVPVSGNSTATRPVSSEPTVIHTGAVGRPRKRVSAQVEATTNVNKAVPQGSSSTAFTATSKEPPRKRSRDQHTVSLTALSALSSNVHTLKPGHIIAWYIDYLIHENEDRTQISRAFTLPVNLFHTDDFYFLDSLRKKIRFPSPKFLAWMQRHLPSLNAHAIDFREGRPNSEPDSQASSMAAWSQDWGWQNKSKRDIIHDVFFFFQHRKAANTEPHQYVGVGTRSKAQLVA